jgi:hypothetical protein
MSKIRLEFIAPENEHLRPGARAQWEGVDGCDLSNARIDVIETEPAGASAFDLKTRRDGGSVFGELGAISPCVRRLIVELH